MKYNHFLSWFFSILLLFFAYGSFEQAYPQTGNQSDVTGPNLQEQFTAPEENRDRSNSESRQLPEVDRKAFENLVISANFEQAIQLFEEYQALAYSRYFKIQLYGDTIPACQVSQSLYNIGKETNSKPAITYVISLENKLDILVIFAQNDACSFVRESAETSDNSSSNPFLRISLANVTRADVEQVISNLHREISNPRKVRTTSYQPFSRQLYQWIIEPLQTSLTEKNIDTLIFCLDRKLRSLPIASLHDGEQFLIEKYQLGLIPSFSFIDPSYRSIQNATILGFGVSDGGKNREFPPLPAVPIELSVLEELWNGQTFINPNATVENLQRYSKNEEVKMMHIATHAEFRSGQVTDSFIQFWDGNMNLDRLREVSQLSQWSLNPRVELLVLSACRTALGSEEAELGFSGLALQAGVKTALGSLWYISDEGALALMAEFYQQLKTEKTKASALRQAQLNLLQGNVNIQNRQLVLSNNFNIPAPERAGDRQLFRHPYYWSAYTLIGNWN
ncbi:CHAT domain-containing protein [Roseofilum casamattae]|uniref:CHAT domain-containing protein n=1 Tax=Roseofilum casamattae BLCC-M143 TaxID=3022442 RepID=A0ABT7C2I3_9CYAN|nr:CHAT domain-containing protein [Roseofilum casamattae]MDJ1185672.1 CHAT domain-containing protein [Roseofilum casamattae BLCC-M143]